MFPVSLRCLAFSRFSSRAPPTSPLLFLLAFNGSLPFLPCYSLDLPSCPTLRPPHSLSNSSPPHPFNFTSASRDSRWGRCLSFFDDFTYHYYYFYY